jgi:Asp-tRNA(Asn)/Glu-tRNA(Gln) amidotransferase B subunit
VADENALVRWVEEVLAAHAAEVARYRAGEAKLLAFFVGQVMKASKGKADPKLVPPLLTERLGG